MSGRVVPTPTGGFEWVGPVVDFRRRARRHGDPLLAAIERVEREHPFEIDTYGHAIEQVRAEGFVGYRVRCECGWSRDFDHAWLEEHGGELAAERVCYRHLIANGVPVPDAVAEFVAADG